MRSMKSSNSGSTRSRPERSTPPATMRPMRTGNSRLGLVAVSIAVVLVAAIPSSRRAVLRAAGGWLIVRDPLERADVGVVPEFGEGGELEAADLYHEHMFSRIVLLEPSPTAVEREYVRRGVYRDDVVATTLKHLGVPEDAIVHVDAGEGGTTESTQALADWIRVH